MSQQQNTASARESEFVATTGGHETIRAENLLIIAYVLMWALVLGFIALSWRRQTRLNTRLDELEKALSEHAPRR